MTVVPRLISELFAFENTNMKGGINLNSILTEINKLRNGSPIHLDETLSDRYTIHCREPQRTKTAYCFSVPIRNIKTNDIVDTLCG